MNDLRKWCYYKFIAEPEGRHIDCNRIPSNWEIELWYGGGYWQVSVKFEEFTWAEADYECTGTTLQEALVSLLNGVKACRVDVFKNYIEIVDPRVGNKRRLDSAFLRKEAWENNGPFGWPKHYSRGK